MQTEDVAANPRPIPDSLVNPARNSEEARRIQREKAAQKKRAFKAMFREVKQQRRRDGVQVPKWLTTEACWKRVASGKFRGADINSEYVKGLIHRNIIEEMDAELERHPEMAAEGRKKKRPMREGPRAADVVTGNQAGPAPAVTVRVLPRVDPAPAPAPAPVAATAAHIREAMNHIIDDSDSSSSSSDEDSGNVSDRRLEGLPRGTVIFRYPRGAPTLPRPEPQLPPPPVNPPPAVIVAREVERVLGEAVRGIVAEANFESGVPDDMTPEAIERLFTLKGVGDSGHKCPVCEDCKKSLIRMNNGCQHMMCSGCVEGFVNANTVKDGAKCFGCVAESQRDPTVKVMYVDPRLVFSSGIDNFRKTSFSSFQIPKLQEELDAMEPKTPEQLSGKCPLCSTVSINGKTVLRRCMNPRCCAEFCVNCNTALDKIEDRAKHLTKACTEMATEAKDLSDKPGMTPCSRCGMPLFHAKGHGCHHVKCASCSYEMCHNCGADWKAQPKCGCPLFCNKDFKCRCAEECPECKADIKPCSLCSGSCTICTSRRGVTQRVVYY